MSIEAMKQATQPAEADEGKVDGSMWLSGEGDAQMPRGIMAYTTPQPAQATQAEVTDELCWQIWDKAGACDEVNERVTLKVAKPIIRAIVAAYLEVAAPRGITTQAKKEGA